MRFTDEEIRLAQSIRDHGVPWIPAAGQYVFDESSMVERGSPFQPGVYFILNYQHFMELAGGSQRFQEMMLWLPTWEDCRSILADLGVNDDAVATHLKSTDAFQSRRERIALYDLILKTLRERRD